MPLEDEARIGRLLHARWLAGERAAIDEILVRYYEHLVGYLRWYVTSRNLYQADEDTIRDAAVDALTSYRNRPAQYDPAKGKTLGGFLQMAAEGDLKNRLSRLRPSREFRVVQLEDEAWNRVIADDAPMEDVAAGEVDASALVEQVLALAANEDERIVARLWWLADERRTEVFAAALGIGHLPPKEQARYVQRIKDRLDKRRRRRLRGGNG
jgi:hypothetical protein